MRSPLHIWPADVLWFGGGQQPDYSAQLKLQKQQQAQAAQQQAKLLAQMQKNSQIDLPAIPAPPPPTIVAQPPTMQSTDIAAAQQDAQVQAANRYGFLKTTYAGNTGGYMGATAPAGAPASPVTTTPTGSSNSGAKPSLG